MAIGDFEAAMQRILNATNDQRDNSHLWEIVKASRLQMMGEVWCKPDEDESNPLVTLVSRYETPENFETEWTQRIKRIG